MKRDDLVAYLDEVLQIRAIEDSSNNGLQVEGGQDVERVALAVDASLAAFVAAGAAEAEMLIVHHGLFWSKPRMVTGIHRQRLKQILDAGLSLYAAHLPLDFHPQLGNNATLARWLDLQDTEFFGEYKGQAAGVAGQLETPLSLDEFAVRVQECLDEPILQVWPFGAPLVRRVGIVSGGAGFLVDQAAAAHVDVYLTGEVSHSIYHDAQELGINVVFGGHYATETAGLKTLAGHLSDQLGLKTVFLDLPTGA